MNRSVMNVRMLASALVIAASFAAPSAASAQDARAAVDSASRHLKVRPKVKPSELAASARTTRDPAFGKAARATPSIVVSKQPVAPAASASGRAAAASDAPRTPAVPVRSASATTKKKKS